MKPIILTLLLIFSFVLASPAQSAKVTTACATVPEHTHSIVVYRVIVSEVSECSVTYQFTQFGPSFIRQFEVPYTGQTNLPKSGKFADLEYCETTGMVLSLNLRNAVGT